MYIFNFFLQRRSCKNNLCKSHICIGREALIAEINLYAIQTVHKLAQYGTLPHSLIKCWNSGLQQSLDHAVNIAIHCKIFAKWVHEYNRLWITHLYMIFPSMFYISFFSISPHIYLSDMCLLLSFFFFIGCICFEKRQQ